LVLKKYLEDNYNVIEAQNAQEAINMMNEHSPDLYLLDVMMPGMDGFTLCEKIKNNDRNSFIPIIIISALEDNESRLKGLDAGADEFITKPVNHFELNMRVKTLLKIKELYDRLEASEKLFKAVFNNLNSGISLLNTNGKRLEVNDKAVEMLGYSKDEIKHPGDKPLSFFESQDNDDVFSDIASGNINEHVSERIVSRKDGSQFWVRHSLSSIKNKEGVPEIVVSMFTDISETKSAEKRLADYTILLKKLIEAIPMPMYVKNADGIFIECNERFCNLVGKKRDDILERKFYSFFDESIVKEIKRAEIELLKNGGHKEFEITLTDSTGKERMFTFYKETFVQGGEIGGLICVMVDFTKRNNLESQLRKANKDLKEQAITDGLTGLFNHKRVLELLEAELKRAQRYQTQLSVLMLDIDYFKKVNDNYGHQVGDEVLMKVSDIIRDNIRETDIAGRYGGEEFLIIFPNTSSKKALNTALRINKAIGDHQYKEGFKITISGGLSDWKGENSSKLIRKADELLYKAKEQGRNRIES